MTPRRVATLLILLMWLALGPIAMAFGACGILGVTCEATCGLASGAPVLPTLARGPEPRGIVSLPARDTLPRLASPSLEPPPKPVPLPA
jgi:hypothetical protein